MKKINNNIEKKKPNNLRFYVILLTVFALLLVVRYSCFVINRCQGNSMYPTIRHNAVVVGTNIFLNIDRNDIVVAQPKAEDGLILKRVVGVEGDHIEIKDGKLYINGNIDTLFPDTNYLDETLDVVVPENSYFLMGDNRNFSEDSRYFGAVNKSEIIYKVIYYSKEVTSP